MEEPFVEYREVSGSEPLGQGDVLEAVELSVPKWQRHLFVITADCDLAHQKHEGRVTCIPLLTTDEYHLEMQVPQLRDKLARKPLRELQSILKRTKGPNVSEQRLREWVTETDADTIVKTLELKNSDADAARCAVECLKLIDSASTNLKDAARTLVEAQMRGTQPPKQENAINNVLSPLRGSYTKPPGDALFLSAIAPAHDLGYFAYLRHLEQVWEPEISISPARREARYRRIARLKERFTHHLVQRFATVFMSIGLPTEYEEMRDLHSEMIGECVK
jgi:hypothetical protein